MPAPTLLSNAVLYKKSFALSVSSPCDDSVMGIPLQVGTDKDFNWSLRDKHGNYGLRLSDLLPKKHYPVPPSEHTTWPELVAHLMKLSPYIEPDPRIHPDIMEFRLKGPAADIAKGKRIWICDCPVCAFYSGFSFADVPEGMLILLLVLPSCTQ